MADSEKDVFKVLNDRDHTLLRGHIMLGSMVEEPKPETKTCPNCGWETTDMSLMFCDACGRRLEGGEEEEAAAEVEKVPTKKVCPNCGWSIFDAETMFCDECGRRLEEAAE